MAMINLPPPSVPMRAKGGENGTLSMMRTLQALVKTTASRISGGARCESEGC